MAYAKGTDAAGGGSTVNQAYLNKIAEEKWAAEQEEKRKREEAEDRQRARERAAQDANAQKQEQLAAQKRAQEQAAAQKAAQEKAARDAAIQAAKQRAQEQQERAAQAEAQREAERAQREAAAAAETRRRDNPSGLSYTGSGTSAINQEREAEWFAPKTEAPAVTVSEPAEQSGAAVNESWMAPDSIAEVETTPRRSGENRAEAQAPKTPIVYTPQTSTEYSTSEARNMAANTKAALTEEESGMSPEQLAWLQSAEGQRALANQQAKHANDAALRAAALNTGITFSGHPITQDKRISGQPMSAEEAARLEAVNGAVTQTPAATSMRFVPRSNSEMLFPTDYGGTTIPAGGNPATPIAKMTAGNGTAQPAEAERTFRYNPKPDTSLDRDLRYPVARMTVDKTPAGTGERTITFSGQPIPESSFLTGQDRIENEQLAYERGLASYMQNNGAQVDSNGTVPIAEWFRRGQAENSVYDQAYQNAYDQVIAAGGSYNQADTVAQNAGNMAVRNYREQQPKTETPVSEGTSLYDEIVNAESARRSGENRAEANAPAAPGQVNGGQGPQYRYTPRTKSTDQSSSESAERNGSVKMTTNGGVSGGQTNNRPGAEATLQEIMDSNYRDGTPGEQRYVYRPGAESTSGSTTGSTKGTSGSATKAASGEARAEKQAPKGSTYFTPSYGQGGKGVKLPYKVGGYDENDLKDAGNNSYGTTSNGKNAYEGYYYWNGKYYPVDQEKAAYYKANGNSYKGWEEPMREYYKTFGTYYGYRPDWKTAGGLNQWKNNTSPSRSYSNYSSSKLTYTPPSSGRSYGRGSTANNGTYWWNGLTSWNA